MRTVPKAGAGENALPTELLVATNNNTGSLLRFCAGYGVAVVRARAVARI